MTLSDDAASVAADAVCALLDGGFLRIRGAGAVLLAELEFSATAFLPAAAGVAVANAITKDSTPVKGEAAYFECVASDGVTVVFTGTISELNPSTTIIEAGVEVSVVSFSYTARKA